jgi:integral membrane protein
MTNEATPVSAPATRRFDPATAFRVVAVAEAFSWLGLLIGMLFKYAFAHNAAGVHIFGPIHGVIFVSYVAVTLIVRSPLRWNSRTTVIALLASIPPFGSLVFEQWAQRTGRLSEAASVGR